MIGPLPLQGSRVLRSAPPRGVSHIPQKAARTSTSGGKIPTHLALACQRSELSLSPFPPAGRRTRIVLVPRELREGPKEALAVAGEWSSEGEASDDIS